MTLWDFAVAVYARPGVEEICLSLQDDHGQCVPLLLWRLWALDRAVDAAHLSSAVELARACEARVIAPLRQARRALSGPIPRVGEDARRAVRGTAKAAELAAERLLLEALDAATPADRTVAADATAALLAVAAQWGAAAPPAMLARLAAAAGSATG